MLNWIKKLLGFGRSRPALPGADGRVPQSEMEIGIFLLQQLDANPKVTEQFLADSLGRDVVYVRRVVGIARATK